MKELEVGSIDLLPMMAYSPERDKIFNFSVPHTIAYDTLFLKKGNTSIRTLKDLTGKTVIIMNKDIAHGYLLSSDLSKTMTLNLVDSLPEALKQLSAGKGDAAIMPKLVGIVTAKQLNLLDIETSPQLVDAYTRPFSFAVKNGNQELLERLNQGLNIIKSTGQYDAIYKKWFGALEDPQINIKTVIKYASVALLIILGFIVWNVILKRQVKSQTAHLLSEIDERKQAEKDLRETKDYLQNLLDYANVPIIVWDDKFFITIFNHAFEKLSGRKCEEVFGRPLEILFPDESKEQSMELIKQTSSGDRWEAVEIPIEHFNGNLRTVLWNSTTIISPENNQPIATIAQGYDITESKMAEVEKTKLETQLQQAQKMESVGRLAGGVAHDFNNLLTVILGGAHLALSEVEPGEPLHEYVTQIQNAANKSADLTQQLLAFARKQTIAPKELNLNQTVMNMLKMLQRLIGEDIKLTFQPETNLWPVKADPSQIDQILANLCVNARDSIAGNGTITIQTGNSIVDKGYSAEHVDVFPGEYIHPSVCDSGCGMDKETMAHIFEPFFTTKGVGEGTGLGLATVYGAVRQNNGFINVYSELGMGTTFTIYLPRYTGNTDQILTNAQAQPAPRGLETILLVEDEASILNMTTMILNKQGYTVLVANSPAEATRLAGEQSGEIDLLITDVIMPEMNGKDLANNLISLYPKLKCLYMSGYTADVIAHHGVLDEGMYFIQKPFSLPDLANKVREVMDAND